jgi:hypothetical protein
VNNRLTILVLSKTDEASLFKVLTGRKSIGDAPFRHHDKSSQLRATRDLEQVSRVGAGDQVTAPAHMVGKSRRSGGIVGQAPMASCSVVQSPPALTLQLRPMMSGQVRTTLGACPPCGAPVIVSPRKDHRQQRSLRSRRSDAQAPLLTDDLARQDPAPVGRTGTMCHPSWSGSGPVPATMLVP